MWQDSCWRLYCRRECARSMSWVAVNVTFTATHDIHCNSWHSLQLMTLTLSMSWDNAMRRWIWHSLQLITLTATHDIDIVDFLRQCHVTVNVTSTATHDFDCNSWHWHCQCQEKMSCAKFSPRQNLSFSKVWKIVCKGGNVFYFSHARAFFVSFSPHVYISPVLAKPETCGASGEAKQIENFLIPWTLNKIDWSSALHRAKFRNNTGHLQTRRSLCLSLSLSVSLSSSLSLSLSLSLCLSLSTCSQHAHPSLRRQCVALRSRRPNPHLCVCMTFCWVLSWGVSLFFREFDMHQCRWSHTCTIQTNTHTFYKY